MLSINTYIMLYMLAMKTSNYYETADKLMITSLVSTTIWKWIEGYFELGFIKNKLQIYDVAGSI